MEFRDDLETFEYTPKGFNRLVGPFHIARLTEREYRMHLDIRDDHLNQGGVVHGGAVMTLADNAMGMAASHAAGGAPASTIEFDVKFIAAAKAGGPLYGAVFIERRTKDVCFMTAELWSGGRKTATVSGIWKYIAARAKTDQTETV